LDVCRRSSTPNGAGDDADDIEHAGYEATTGENV
jgi:hypothetical protein